MRLLQKGKNENQDSLKEAMEACCSRFTAAEGGTRLAATASARNILVVEYSSFISTRLIYENAYKIRGSLYNGQQRSVYITRASRVPVVTYELRILTDLAIGSAVRHDEVYDWTSELDKKEVLVCTSEVLKQVLLDEVLTMENINVLVLDSCHLVSTDPDLQYIMKRYKACGVDIQPRILALTYPLFSSPKKEATPETDSKNKTDSISETLPTITKNEETCNENKETEAIDKNDDPTIDENKKIDDNTEEKDTETSKEVVTEKNGFYNKRDDTEEIGSYVNLDDFEMYEKIEWKIDQLEKELSCQMDLAEDIDGGKRISATLTKPKELIIEYNALPTTDELPVEYIELQNFMKETVNDALEFIDEHRYDPSEIYGEDLYEEFINIPDPTLDPRHVFKQFLYVLEQLGPYAADKAAFSLLTKLEKLKIKVPYERHFLLLCLCTSVFVKIRCYADLVFSKYESDWEKIKVFSTPKVLRFAEILGKFQPPEQARDKLKNGVAENTRNMAENSSTITENTGNSTKNTTSSTESKTITISKTDAMLNAIEKCDFKTLSNRIEDKVNTFQANLKEIDDLNIENSIQKETAENNTAQNETNSTKEVTIIEIANENNTSSENAATIDKNNEINTTENNVTTAQTQFKDGRSILGFPRRSGHRSRGRGRVQRSYLSRALQMQLNPDALCGIVFVKEALMAKILFMLIVDMSRCHPKLSHLCAQYCAVEDPGTELRECQRQGKKQEDVLKKFRMHECNLLLATSALEEGIDLPRCNLVLRWDVPASYRSYGLCRGRARAARATCALLSSSEGHCTDTLLHNVAVYRELDQIISRKCGCGIQDEPPQSEEDHADSFTRLVKPYTPNEDININPSESRNVCDTSEKKRDSLSGGMPNNDDNFTVSNDLLGSEITENKQINNDSIINSKNKVIKGKNDNIYCNKCSSKRESVDVECSCVNSDVSNSLSVNKEVKKKMDSDIASVDLSTAIALINRYCGKLPSDTFTRLAASWSMEQVRLPARGTGEYRTAYICTMRLPLNCPVKYNIVGHPMPTRVLARRMVALQACRILHKSGELDNQLMPIGKENFKAADLDTNITNCGGDASEPNDSARPGTTKRRQYYYKRTAWAFTDCQPIIDTSDSEIDPSNDTEKPKVEPKPEKEAQPGQKRNMLYAIVSTLWCALPERYNTRGRRLHAPQNAQQAVAILMARDQPQPLQIPAFPVYTRSGEVRVSVEYVPDADVRMSPRRGRLVRRFMRFVFADVLRVRRRGMKLQSEGSTHNNYYIVPTIKTTRADGSTKIDIDWAFLELIYQYTEEKKLSEVEKPILWNQDEEEEEDSTTTSKVPPKERDKDDRVKKMQNPLLQPGETFVFDPDKYREAVVTPWYRNQDQPQFFLVAEICWKLTPDSEFPSDTHKSFRDYYSSKYGVALTQSNQPLLDVDHTSARLNLLTPRYVNRKGVALPVSSERTRRAKRDRLDQKQILVGELCRVHPFAAPLWFATVALPCVLYRINALLIADEIRRAVAIDVGLGIPQIDDNTCPGFQWPPLDFGWSLAEVLSTDEKVGEKKKEEEDSSKKNEKEIREREVKDQKEKDEEPSEEGPKEKTLNDILQEKEVDSCFEIGTWTNDMASSLPAAEEYDEYMEPLPSNLTFCTSASGGTNWCDPVEKPKSQFNPSRPAYSMADSDCSFLSSDFDTDDSDLNSENSDEDTDTSGFCSSKNSNAAMGVRIEYKTAHEAEAVDLERKQKVSPAPQPDPQDDASDRLKHETFIRNGDPPEEYIEKFRVSVKEHKKTIVGKGFLIHKDEAINEILPEQSRDSHEKTLSNKQIEDLATKLSKIDFKIDESNKDLFKEVFPYGTSETDELFNSEQITLESIEKNKRILLAELRKSLPLEEIRKLNCFSMVDVDIDSTSYVNEKVVNVGFDTSDNYVGKITTWDKARDFNPYYMEGKGDGKEFDFDYQPDLDGHPGPSPSVILQALTMSNANDGINLERLETIGDSFLKFAITAYLYCAHPTVHEGKLSHMRSKQVSNLNLYRLGRNKRLGARMIASKFEPHDNWLPPCHRAPATPSSRTVGDTQENSHKIEVPLDNAGCFIPYNLITQHSIPDKSIADCVEALIGAYLLECGPRGALLFMSWLGIKVLPRHTVELPSDHPYVVRQQRGNDEEKLQTPPSPRHRPPEGSDSDTCTSDESDSEQQAEREPWRCDWGWEARPVGSAQPRRRGGGWVQDIYGELKAPPSPLLRYIEDPEGELEQMLSGYDALERTLQYRFKDRSLLLQALTHASHQQNRLTDCYQRLEFLGDAILDYLITRHLYEDPRRHSPGALTDLRSALVNNTIFATLAARHGFHKYFRHMSPGLNEVLTKYVRIQEENGHSISEEHYLIQEDEMEQAEDVEVPKALGDLFESVAGAIFLDSGMSLGAVWQSYVLLMGAELEAFSAAAPKSPVRELLEAEPDTAKFGKPERLADGRRVRVCVEVFGRGAFKGVGRNYRIAKGTAARCALRHLRAHRR